MTYKGQKTNEGSRQSETREAESVTYTHTMTDKTIIEELAIFLWGKPVEADATKKAKQLLPFIRKQLTLAEKREANEICKLIDDIELSYHDTSLEEWKAFKHIRNAIRDKYVLKSFQSEEENK